MYNLNRRNFIKKTSLAVASLAASSSLSVTNYVFDAENIIKQGKKVTIGPGNTVNYINLPNQPVAVVVYNNTGNNTHIIFDYISRKDVYLDSVSSKGYSIGDVYLLNPRIKQNYNITVSIPHTEPRDSSVDIYCVSLLFPLNCKGINNFKIKEDPTNFYRYSRAYATPQPTWYSLSLQMESYGFLGLLFKDQNIEIIGLNINTSEKVCHHIKEKIYYDFENTGICDKDISFRLLTATRCGDYFYGTSSQLVIASISSAKTTRHFSISLDRL